MANVIVGKEKLNPATLNKMTDVLNGTMINREVSGFTLSAPIAAVNETVLDVITGYSEGDYDTNFDIGDIVVVSQTGEVMRVVATTAEAIEVIRGSAGTTAKSLTTAMTFNVYKPVLDVKSVSTYGTNTKITLN